MISPNHMKRLAKVNKSNLRAVRHNRVRSRMIGTKETPRLSVFRSLRSMTAQLVDDTAGKTIAFAKSSDLKSVNVEGKTAKVAAAYAVGKALAEKAKGLGISKVVFDRGGYRYHGRVEAVAQGAREGGLQF